MINASTGIPKTIVMPTGNPVVQEVMEVLVDVLKTTASREQPPVRAPGWLKIVRQFAILVRPIEV